MADQSADRRTTLDRFVPCIRTGSPASWIRSGSRGPVPALLAMAVCLLALSPASAQTNLDGYRHLQNQRTAPGETAAWLTHIRGRPCYWLQPIRIDVPGGGDVSVYSASLEPAATAAAPALVAVNAGHTYRLRLANMPQFPNVELYPSIEILDRLHPPAGEENQYPIPIPFSESDIRHAVEGRLVTRVIYLERPEAAQQLDPLHRDIPQAVLPSENVLQAADRMGRPMVIIRLGSRRPSTHQASTMFFGSGGAVELRSEQAQATRTQITRTALQNR